MRARERHDGEHGPGTLRIISGEVVGKSGDDVFVELGPRMQGVISARKFPSEPEVGERFDFKLHGQEESLWVLSLAEEASLSSWRNMERGALVQAHAVRTRPGGLELKVGPLHAFMPASQTGLPRGEKPSLLVGRNLLCEVIEIDPERQRILLSRKLVAQREREDERYREVGQLRPGQVVQGRVVRIEEYGVFLRFGRGLEGLIHISNLAHERVEHPSEIVKKGDALSARVLSIKSQGKKVALGLKQMDADPWEEVERRFYLDQIVESQVTRVQEFGVFLTIARGVEGLLPRSLADLPPHRSPREQFQAGARIAVRIHDLEPEAQRLTVSRLHRDGSAISEDEVIDRSELDEYQQERGSEGVLRSSLQDVLRKALEAPSED